MNIEKLLDGLMVSIEPFVICRTSVGPKLNLSPMGMATLHYVVAGRGSLLVGNQPPISLESGSIVILPPGVAHQLIGTGEEDEALSIAKNCLPIELGLKEIDSCAGEGGIVVACSTISVTYQKVQGLFDYLNEPIISSASDDNAVGHIIKTVLEEMAHPKPGSNALITLLMKQCLIYVLRQYCERGRCQVPWLSALEDPQLSVVLEQMIDEPGRRFTLELLAENAGMSRSAFSQRFKSAFGRSAMDFLKELRLQRAAHLLKTTKKPIKSIADQVGFDSRSHFSKSFSSYFETSPAEFRNALEQPQ